MSATWEQGHQGTLWEEAFWCWRWGGTLQRLCKCTVGQTGSDSPWACRTLPWLGQLQGPLGCQDNRLITSRGCNSSTDTRFLLKVAVSCSISHSRGTRGGFSKDLGLSSGQPNTWKIQLMVKAYAWGKATSDGLEQKDGCCSV